MPKKMKKRKHKYLNDLGIKSDEICIFNTSEKKDKRADRFKKERKKYGFDSRETWCLGWTMIGWMYSHLKMYLETGGRVVNLSFHKFDVPVLVEIPEDEREVYEGSENVKAYQKEVITNLTQEEAINTALGYMEYYLKNNDTFKHEEETRAIECAQCAMKIVAEVFPALWW